MARSLAPHPRYLLMDEPVVNLDLNLKESILVYILEFVNMTNTNLIYVTHDSSEASCVSKRVLCMKNNRITSPQAASQEN